MTADSSQEIARYISDETFRGQFAQQQSEAADVRFGSKADMCSHSGNVRFTPKSGHWNSVAECPLCAISRHSALRQRLALFDHYDARGTERAMASAGRPEGD